MHFHLEGGSGAQGLLLFVPAVSALPHSNIPVDVSEEVKIPRPTTQVFEAARRAMQDLLASTDAETRRILDSYLDTWIQG